MDHWDLVWCALHNFFPFPGEKEDEEGDKENEDDDLGYPEEGEVYRVE
jgi:hypothetical protein